MRYGRFAVFAAMALAATAIVFTRETRRRSLAGDSHIHSYWSPGYDRTKPPPEPVQGGDALSPTALNARKALNMPAMDHHTLIIPRTDDEWKVLPADPSRNSEAAGC